MVRSSKGVKHRLVLKMHDKKDSKLGDSFYNTKDNKWYYFDGLNWVLALMFVHRNYKGSINERCVIPLSVFYGVTDFYKTPQYFLRCWDIERKAYRDFGFRSIQSFV